METHIMKISGKYLYFLRNGIKKTEGRLNDEDRQKIKKGHHIIFKDRNSNDECKFIVKDTIPYKSIRQMLEKEGVSNMLPDENDLEKAIKTYKEFGEYEKYESLYGMVAIKLEKYIQ
jgi:ASC-1-like (ASCH) protein